MHIPSPKLLDLFCGAGGAAHGYVEAGFAVTGVDIKPQNAYLASGASSFVLGDAMALLQNPRFLRQFDAIHASPPCQGYSQGTARTNDTPRLIWKIRALLDANAPDVPYVIENVTGARGSMHGPITLCGSMFGLNTTRHRLFECGNFACFEPGHPNCWGLQTRYAESLGVHPRIVRVMGHASNVTVIQLWRDIMHMPWAITGNDLSEAIPPAYTSFIGRQLHDSLQRLPAKSDVRFGAELDASGE